MAKNQIETKSKSKKTTAADMTALHEAEPRTHVLVGSKFLNAEHGAFRGDAAVVQNLPEVDRAGLARHLVAVAGNIASTVGDPISGATIVILTRRADG